MTAAPSKGGTPVASELPGGLAARPGLPLVDGEVAGCVPGCEKYGNAQGGRLPVGRYQTKWFFGGYMTIESDGSWPISEDSTAELSLIVREAPTDYLLRLTGFWLDPQLFLHGVRDTEVEMTAQAYADWLQGHPDLIVSPPVPATIGSMPALYVGVKLGPTTVQDGGAADCGSEPCVLFINNPRIPKGFEHVDGILGTNLYRFYFADITYAGTDHLLTLKVEGSNQKDLEATVARLKPLLESATFPARPR